MNDVHGQIDQIIYEIKERINELKKLNKFRPWDVEELTPKYWMKKGSLSVDENVNLRTIDDIGSLFMNIPRYLDTFEEEEPVDIQAVQKDILN